jgi:chromosome segregation ATPase
LDKKEFEIFKAKIREHIMRVIEEYISANFGKDLCKMEKKCQDYEKENTELRKEIAKLTNNDSQLKAQRETSKKEIANLKEEISKWKNMIIAKDEVISNLKDHISNLKDKLINHLFTKRNGDDEFKDCD